MKRPTPKKTAKARPWTKEDIKTLKALVREKTKTSVIAHKLERTEAATRQKASSLGVKLAVRLRKAKA
jgi:predicted transport protein